MNGLDEGSLEVKPVIQNPPQHGTCRQPCLQGPDAQTAAGAHIHVHSIEKFLELTSVQLGLEHLTARIVRIVIDSDVTWFVYLEVSIAMGIP